METKKFGNKIIKAVFLLKKNKVKLLLRHTHY